MDFLPTADIPSLRQMAALCRAARRFFDERGFFEVITPVLSRDVLIDLHVEPISLKLADEELFLQTSPEFAMKRLLAGGADRIYQIAHAFRRGDRGACHNIEFTLLEWYRAGDNYDDGMNLLADLAEALLDRPRPARRSFAELFISAVGINPHLAAKEELQTLCDARGIAYPESFVQGDAASADDWLDLIFTEKIQPGLGAGRPVIVYDYPACEPQLARTRTVTERGESYQVTQRFELFADSLELANGYHELTDAEELIRRFERIAEKRRRLKKPILPTESRLLKAMRAGLPASSGCALGMERAAMVRFGKSAIDQVLPFPIERA
ncbi:MAG: EF-P lysine aminoacylase GenX [Thermoguttaceae bacterium]|nr:EF-P lysine aminoacylase GenX [Thermoguttaceae bacterium]